MNAYHGKKILILGLARSGLSVAKLLIDLGAQIKVNDAKPLDSNPEAKELIDRGITVVTGYHPEDILTSDYDFLVKNPGIPYSNPVVQQAVTHEIPIITEVEVATSIIESNMIAVTGTNGKTTTVSLIRDILSHHRNNGRCFTAGNIGVPVSEIALEAKPEDDVLLELSSFQLMASKDFKPHIAVINNLYSAHLDYHTDRDEYVRAKLNITKNQIEQDYLIYYADQEELQVLVERYSKAQLIPFSMKKELAIGAYVANDAVYFNNEFVMHLKDIQLNGLHNIQNILAAVCVAKLNQIDNEIIAQSVNQFTGVEHRSQVVNQFNNRVFINDSKATNPLATQKALEGFKKPVVLIAGGLDRHETFEGLNDYLTHVKGVITFGETREKLAQYFNSQGIKEVKIVETVVEAVPIAYDLSEEDSIILFSPACASWDQYETFEQRGDDYVKSIEELIEDLQTKE